MQLARVVRVASAVVQLAVERRVPALPELAQALEAVGIPGPLPLVATLVGRGDAALAESGLSLSASLNDDALDSGDGGLGGVNLVAMEAAASNSNSNSNSNGDGSGSDGGKGGATTGAPGVAPLLLLLHRLLCKGGVPTEWLALEEGAQAAEDLRMHSREKAAPLDPPDRSLFVTVDGARD